ncbi:ATP-binding cassette domain-containing protein [Shewanella surugensis]|uniref:ATP-binding cassette domain-containing protein n=1 Tax=Shewanella surugensis TaxID=212020 RepID=A0ABT0L971_9GAMM|nr:ATP-binding cassette domain-containing protein [Shewanella surugensis]MCL1124262.1 ATP-binding cassette domain-containing protein [Shewanella surugensis]
MSILIDFGNIGQRLNDFESPKMHARYSQSPLIKGIAYSLITLQWEGTPDILSDAFIPTHNDIDSFKETLIRLGYQCNIINLKHMKELNNIPFPAFIAFQNVSGILVNIENETAYLFDYINNTLIEHSLDAIPCTACVISEYSKIFREPSPESQDKSNWIKYAFHRYNNEFKSLILLSFIVNILGALQPFFIMSVYSFALTSDSVSTLYWLGSFAISLAIAEFFFKRMRMNILTTSGKDLALHISKNVIGKLLWLPYPMTSSAGVSSQLARLRDIDQFRKLVTAESTLSYFDMPFVIVFILAITLLSGAAALTVLIGIVIMLFFCIYARYLYVHATSKSSRANTMVSYQWNELLRGVGSMQGLPLLRITQSRFSAAHSQSLEDGENVSVTNSKVQGMGQALIQTIGTASIVTAVLGVMDGTSDVGAMLAIVILVWKALSPIMGIYNSIVKFKSIQSSAKQINALMSLNDDQTSLEKSPPIRTFNGEITVSGLTHRHLHAATGLTNLGFTFTMGDKISIVGPSGSGKTTLLSILSGLEDKYQGVVYMDGYNIKQFNNYRYRKAINYIPFELRLFEGSLASNFILHNGMITREQMQDIINSLDLNTYLPQGLDTILDNEFIQQLSSSKQQSIRLALGVGACDAQIIIIDEPFCGVEEEHITYMNKLLSDKLAHSTVIYTTNSRHFIAASSNCLLLDTDGSQKYFGFPDKVIQSMNT